MKNGMSIIRSSRLCVAIALVCAFGLAAQVQSQTQGTRYKKIECHDDYMIEEGMIAGLLKVTYDTALEPERVRKLATHLVQKELAGNQVPLRVCPIPTMQGSLLVIGAHTNKTVKSTGVGFVIFAEKDGEFQLIGADAPADDTYEITPLFFIGEDTVLLFAEFGTEYSWGYRVYEISRDNLRPLGYIKVAKPGLAGPEPANDRLAVYKSSRGVRVFISGDAILNPGGDDEILWGRDKGPLVFRLDKSGFVMEVNQRGH